MITAESAEIRDLYPLHTSQKWLPVSSTRGVDLIFVQFFLVGQLILPTVLNSIVLNSA